MPVLDYISSTHYNSLFTVTAIITCIFDSKIELRLFSAQQRLSTPDSKMYIYDPGPQNQS